MKGFGPAQAVAALGRLNPVTFPLARAMTKVAKRLDDKNNVELIHEQGFFQDGSEDNIGLGSKGIMRAEDKGRYEMEPKGYDGNRMRRAIKSIDTKGQRYNLLGIGGKKNNCQDFADTLKRRYGLLERGDKQR